MIKFMKLIQFSIGEQDVRVKKKKKTIKEIKVNWKGYPKKFQSWIPESYLV